MKNIILILFFISSTHFMHAMGISDWMYETKHGNAIQDPGGAIHLWVTKNNTELSDLKRWYFYKDHIIGEYVNFIKDKPKQEYFILNELNGDLQTYSDINLFENAVTMQKLKPVLWARWYTDHFQILYMLYILFVIFWLFYLPVAILLLLIIVALIYGCFFVKNKIVQTSCITCITSMISLFVLTIISDYCVNSI